MLDVILSKQCTKCKQILPISNFRPHTDCRDGYRYRCRECERLYHRRRRQLTEVRQRENEYSRLYRQQRGRGYNKAAYLSEYSRTGSARQAIKRALYHNQLLQITHCFCVLCFHEAHVYHHYLGYAPEHVLDVLPLCGTCHKKAHRLLIGE